MSMVSEFRKFIAKGNVMDLAVGVIIGAAFQKIVDSLVTDVVMPVVGLVLGARTSRTCSWSCAKASKAPAPYASLVEARAAAPRCWATALSSPRSCSS